MTDTKKGTLSSTTALSGGAPSHYSSDKALIPAGAIAGFTSFMAPRTATGVTFATILANYHWDGRFIHDGIFSVEKLPLQQPMDRSKLPEIAAAAKEKWDIAKLGYTHKGNDRHEVLGRRTDPNELDTIAYRDRQTGKITIVVCGLELPFKNGDTVTNTLMNGYTAFQSTAGAVSNSTPNLVEFARGISEKYGPIDAIAGHSIGGYLAMQLKVIGDKQGFLPPHTTLHTFDTPGMPRTLANGLKKQYQISESDLEKSLKNSNVVSVINRQNAYNTLGAQPGIILTATDPQKTPYHEHRIQDLLPYGHTIAPFDKSFEKGEWFEGNNTGHSRGPEYLTGFAVCGVASSLPGPARAYGMLVGCGWPVARHAVGELQEAYPKAYQGFITSIVDALSPSTISEIEAAAKRATAFKNVDMTMSGGIAGGQGRRPEAPSQSR